MPNALICASLANESGPADLQEVVPKVREALAIYLLGGAIADGVCPVPRPLSASRPIIQQNRR